MVDDGVAVLSPDRVTAVWDFAAHVHNRQRVPGTDLPYLRHLGLVALEIMSAHSIEPIADIDLALCCAILHDAIEDQAVEASDLSRRFGPAVAAGVSALSKDPSLPKDEAMGDSLARIREQPLAVWCVKLADRISNLRGAPRHWPPARIEAYREESVLIWETLGAAHRGLAERLALRIRSYPH